MQSLNSSLINVYAILFEFELFKISIILTLTLKLTQKPLCKI